MLDKRERLYSQFITECSKLAIDALDHTLDDPAKMDEVYALQNRIRLLATASVIEEADRTLMRIIQRYAAANLAKDEMRAIALTRPKDPLKPFGEACRAELDLLRAHTPLH
jgi:hypothetical protein